MVKSGWTKPTKVAAVRLDLPNYEQLVAAARREGLNVNDYLKALVQERLDTEGGEQTDQQSSGTSDK